MQTTTQTGRGNAALWASAAIILALIIVQAGRLGTPESQARADLVSQSEQYTILTFNGGNEDVVAVLDGRGEELFLYQVKNRTRLEFIGREVLPTLFQNARGTGGGGGRK